MALRNVKCNIGATDKKIRIAIGLIIFITLFALRSWWFVGGAIFIFIALLEWCPFYGLFRINTCKVPKKFWQ